MPSSCDDRVYTTAADPPLLDATHTANHPPTPLLPSSTADDTPVCLADSALSRPPPPLVSLAPTTTTTTAALPPPSAHHRPPAVATPHTTLKLPLHPPIATSTNSPPSHTAPARLWQPAFSASGLLHPTRNPSIVPAALHPPARYPGSHAHTAPSCHPASSPHFPCCVAHGHAALTSAPRLLAYHPAHLAQLGRRSRI